MTERGQCMLKCPLETSKLRVWQSDGRVWVWQLPEWYLPDCFVPSV
ncbi:unnamed protein product, partial [Staurois parvus]